MNIFVYEGLSAITSSGLKPNSDKTVTNPSLEAGVIRRVGGRRVNPGIKAGVSGYTSYRGFSPDGTATCLRGLSAPVRGTQAGADTHRRADSIRQV